MIESEFFIHRSLPEGLHVPTVTLTYEQNKQFQMTIGDLLWNAPFFGDLCMQQLPMVPTLFCPIAATDGIRIYYNPVTFFKYRTPNQAFAIAHEVMHYVYNDVNLMHIWRETKRVKYLSRTLPYIDFLMGVSMDYSINALLIKSKIGEFHTDWLYNPDLSFEGQESQVQVYAKLYDKLPPVVKKWAEQGCKPKDGDEGQEIEIEARYVAGVPNPIGPQGTPRQFDKHLRPGEGQGKKPEETIKARNENEVKVAVAAAAATAKAQGKLPDELRRFINEVLTPKVPWYEEIKTLSMRRAGADGLDWTQLDEHMLSRPEPYGPIAWPAETNYGCGVMVMGGDTSGSIQQPQLNRIFAEMAGMILQVNPRQLWIAWCDAAVGRLDYLEEPEDLEHYRLQVDSTGGVKGGGGTDFRPVFDKIEEMGIEPDVLVYFTDLEGTFPSSAPRYPVVWGALTDHKPPFGDVVRVKL